MPERFSWRRALAEALFVLAGILLAFWIDAWWDRQKAAQLQAEVLAAVAVEIQENHRSLEIDLVNAEARQSRIDAFFRLSPNTVPDISTDSVGVWLRRLMNAPTYEPILGASLLLVDTPALEADGIAARTLVNQWLRSLADAEDRKQTLWAASEEVLRLMAPYAGRYAANGRDNVTEMAAKAGPAVLSELRADGDFVNAVALKGHWQAVYVARLRRAIPLLDSLTSVLGDRASAGGT